MDEPKLRLIVGGKGDRIESCSMNQSPQTPIVSSLTRLTSKWPRSGLSDPKPIDFKSERSWLSEIKSFLTATTACLQAGLKTLVRRTGRTEHSSRSQSSCMPSPMPSRRSLEWVTGEQMAARCTPRTPHALSARSLRSSVASNESSIVDRTASPMALTCFEPLVSKSINYQLLDFSRIYPKDFFDQNPRTHSHPRTDSVYSSSAGRDAALRSGRWLPSASTSERVPRPHPRLSLVSAPSRHESAGDV